MANALPEPEDDHERERLADIARVGWAVVGIPEDEAGPGYAFSVGLYRTFGHPEVVRIGLPWDVADRLINAVGAAVGTGNRYEPGHEYNDLIEGYPTAFVAVGRRHYEAYLGAAGWFYRGWDFPAVQLVWCDRDRRWPWEEGQARGYWRRQPVLGRHVEPGVVTGRGPDSERESC